MSAFFIAINRNKRPFDSSVADNMMAQLDRFGHDARHLVVQDHYAIGYQSNWTVPEEKGEQQPLQVHGDQWFMFYGRLDNREILFSALDPNLNLNPDVSDAVLAQLYLNAFGVDRLADLIGPFVLASFDAATDKVIFARDGMGARHLSYQITDDYILAATYEMALVAHPSIEYQFNDETVACHIVGQMQPVPSSVIAGVDLLYPGYFIECDFSAQNKFQLKHQRFYKPDPKKRVAFDTDEEYAAEFKRLLTQSVNRRMRCISNIGSQLSGGLDSVPVTILAANQAAALAATNEAGEGSPRLSAYSWVFNDYPEADERQYSSPLCQKYAIEQVSVECDDRWLSYDNATAIDPLGPVYNPFSAYNHALFKQAKSRSVKVMLNGIHGDILYGYTQAILYELIRSGEFKQAWAQACLQLRLSGSIKSFVKNFILKPLSIVNRILSWRNRRNGCRDDILQPAIVKQFSSSVHYLARESRHALRPQQWQVVLSDFAGNDAARGRFFESVHGIERRYPFRDRDLCEFMLAIPSKQLALNDVKRPIVKRAFLGEFPDNMATRNVKAHFSEPILEGLRNDSQSAVWANAAPREWLYYVKKCYFDGEVEQSHLFDIIKWRCGYYNYWKSICYYPLAKKIGLSNETSTKK